MKRVTILTALILLISSALYAATRERPMLLRVDLQDKKTLEILVTGHFDIAYVSRR